MSVSLKNKVAVITGAGRGIGKAFAQRFAKEGAKVFIPDISLERAQETVKEIQAKGGEAAAILCDISDQKSTQKMAKAVLKKYGSVDILINNAAIYYGLNITPWDQWKTEDWDRIFSVNVKGTWLVCQAIAPIMVQQKKGKIINIASNIPHVAAAGMLLPYACSKSAIYTLTQGLARLLGPLGINVNAIAPGYTASEASLAQKESKTILKISAEEHAIKRREEPQDLVGTAVFLASSDSDFITGQIIMVDGGAVML